MINKYATGLRLYRLRTARHLRVEFIAELCGVSVAAVYRWESGETIPTLPHLVPLCIFYGVGLDDIVVIDRAKCA